MPDFHRLAHQLHDLLGCGAVHLLLGCPEPQLRHPLLELFPSDYYFAIGGSADIENLLHNERVRALCDIAMQTGQVQSKSFQGGGKLTPLHAVQCIVVAPLERPAGLLGLFLLTDPEAFSHGELLLLSDYLHRAAQTLEQDLWDLSITLLRPHLADARNGSLTGRKENPTINRGSTEVMMMSDDPTINRVPTQEARDEFISMVSHELRMPLTSIKGYAGLLHTYGIAESAIGEMTPARQRQYLATIIEQADHLEVLIADMLDMSRIQAGRLALRFTHVDVAHVCQRVAELAQQRVDQQQPGRYTIRCLLDPQLPLAWADPDRTQQVLTNLLENAIKYSPRGGMIELLAHACPTPFNSHAPNEDTQAIPVGPRMLSITIRDQGIGIAQQQQSLLFKPFSRLEHPATDGVSGAGLGLYITRKLVEAMHGHVTLESSEGAGTSVTFTLPVVTQEVSSLQGSLVAKQTTSTPRAEASLSRAEASLSRAEASSRPY